MKQFYDISMVTANITIGSTLNWVQYASIKKRLYCAPYKVNGVGGIKSHYYSDDYGATWAPMYTDARTVSSTTFTINSTPVAIRVSQDGTRLLLIIIEGGIYYACLSVDSGVTWQVVCRVLSSDTISVSPDLSAILIGAKRINLDGTYTAATQSALGAFFSSAGEYGVMRSNALVDGANYGTYYTTDKGVTWTLIPVANYTALGIAGVADMTLAGIFKKGTVWTAVHMTTAGVFIFTPLTTLSPYTVGGSMFGRNATYSNGYAPTVYCNGVAIHTNAIVENIGDLTSKLCVILMGDIDTYSTNSLTTIGVDYTTGEIIGMTSVSANVYRIIKYTPITSYIGRSVKAVKNTYSPISGFALVDDVSYIINFNNSVKIGYIAKSADATKLAKTVNGGATWTTVNTNIATLLSGQTYSLASLSVSDSGTRVAMSVSITAPISGIAIIVSTDGGVTFTIKSKLVSPNSVGTYFSMSGDGATICLMNSAGSVITSADEGATWTTVKGNISNTNLFVAAATINYDGSLIRIIQTGSSAVPVVYTSTDKGVTWTSVASPIAANSLTDMCAVSQSGQCVVIMSGRYKTLYISSNGGISYNSYTVTTPLSSATQGVIGSSTLRPGFISNDGYTIVLYGSDAMPYICDTRVSPGTFYSLSNGIIGAEAVAPTQIQSSKAHQFIATDGCTILNINVVDGYNVSQTLTYPYRRYVIEKADGFYTFVAGVLTKAASETAAFNAPNLFNEIDPTKLTGVTAISIYTNDTTYAKSSISYGVLPAAQLITSKSDILFNDKINNENLTNFKFNGNGNVRLAYSYDSGSTWKAYKGGTVSNLPDLSEATMTTYGSTPSDINSLADNAQFFTDMYANSKVRFAVLMFKNATSDTCDVTSIVFTFKVRGDWMPCLPGTEYTQKTRYQTCTVTFNAAGDYKVNYTKG